MLVLKRKEGQWVEITHRSGDILRIRVCNVEFGHLNLAFDDKARNFEIERPERHRTADTVRTPGPVIGNCFGPQDVPDVAIPIDRKYYRGTLVDPGFDEFQR